MRGAIRSVLLAVTICCAALGCSGAAGRRLQQDALVAAAAPVQIPVGGIVDTVRVHRAKPWTTAAFPVVFVHHTLKHAVVSALHTGDIFAYPVAAITGADPIDLYETGTFPFRVDTPTSRKVMGRFYVFAGATSVGAVLTVYSYRAWSDIFHKWDWQWGQSYRSGSSYVFGLGTLTGAFLVGYGLYAPFNYRLDNYLGWGPVAALLEVSDEES